MVNLSFLNRFAFVLLVFMLLILSGCSTKFAIQLPSVERLHRQILTIDTHCDTPMRLRQQAFNIGERHEPTSAGGQVDLIRMQEGGLDAMVFAVFIAQGDRTMEGYAKAYALVQETLTAIQTAVAQNANFAEIAYSPRDIKRIVRKGKIAILLGIENGYAIGKDLTLIEKYYKQGIRYITLCHTKNNDICDSSTDTTEHGGLSPFGEAVVREMNRVGMIIDVSHISDSAFYDVVRISRAPVIASHSCARAICGNPRNLDDNMLLALKKNGGVIQINLFTEYVKPSEPNAARDSAMHAFWSKYANFEQLTPSERAIAYQERDSLEKRYPRRLATVEDMTTHIDHVVQTIGIDYLGIGSDFDGGGGLADCYDVSQMKNITATLVKHGYTKSQIARIWGGNFLRVWQKVNRCARRT